MSTPIRRTRSVRCARAASGHAAALPISVMNSRRLRSNTGFYLRGRFCRTLSLPQGGRQVLWAT